MPEGAEVIHYAGCLKLLSSIAIPRQAECFHRVELNIPLSQLFADDGGNGDSRCNSVLIFLYNKPILCSSIVSSINFLIQSFLYSTEVRKR